jgi:hypothetical protein
LKSDKANSLRDLILKIPNTKWGWQSGSRGSKPIPPKKKKLLKIGNEEKILRTNRDKRYIVTDGRAKNRMQISH